MSHLHYPEIINRNLKMKNHTIKKSCFVVLFIIAQMVVQNVLGQFSVSSNWYWMMRQNNIPGPDLAN